MNNDNDFEPSNAAILNQRNLCRREVQYAGFDPATGDVHGQHTIVRRPWPPIAANDEDRILLRNEFLQPIKKEEKMFKNFKDVSRKLIEVPATIYELITDHELRAIHLPRSAAKDLLNESSFVISCGDATIVVDIESTSNSKVSCSDVVVTFEFN